MEEHPVALAMIRALAEELRNQLQIGGFTTSRAGAGEFKQRLLHLLLADRG